MLEIYTEGSNKPYRLHLHAFKPAPDIQYEPLVNLRYIPLGQERCEFVEFRNEGRLTGHINLVEEPKTKSGIKIEPARFSLDPDETIRVKVGLVGDNNETISKQITVKVDGTLDHGTMDV